MRKIKTNIIPSEPFFIGTKRELDHEAICVFTALGFFLDNDTYYKALKVARPASILHVEGHAAVEEKPYFKWHYRPKQRPFNEVVEEFAVLFEQIIDEQVQNKKVILPLSGGLDSRTQAVALKQLQKDVHAYSYRFQNGLNESDYGKKIAQACQFPFADCTIPKGYLWDCMDHLAQRNQCYADFTHPRQMAVINQLGSMGDVFSLGHWGDVLFDDMGVPDSLPFEAQVEFVLQKLIKKGGLELATTLWREWELEGNFQDYLRERVTTLLRNINIPESANAQIRAFKSLYWAPRWTSTNLAVFAAVKPITLPYYDNRMCEFITSVPEQYLAGRQIQIEYIKQRNPKLAQITWQQHRPFNLYNYHRNSLPYNLPYRIMKKVQRSLQSNRFVQRNWELQFLGKENESQLKKYLLEQPEGGPSVPKAIIQDFYHKFTQEDKLQYAHPLSMILTLEMFFKEKSNKNEKV